MTIIEIFTETKRLEPKSFLQTPEWGSFQNQVGVTPRHFLIGNESIQIFEFKILGGVFWYAPFISLKKEDYFELENQAKKQGNVIFIRVESLSPIELPYDAVLVKHRQPQHSLILDLQKSGEELLAGMHQKTRYNIRLASKKNLIISWEKNAEVFNTLMNETSARDKFGAHSSEYYTKMLECPLVEQVTVYALDQPSASAIFIGSGNTYTYLHGASSNFHRELMAPFLVQWSAIIHAKERGFEVYDFWGVASEDAPNNHPWSGITRFKLGFGGTRTVVGPAFEIPIKKLRYSVIKIYKIYNLVWKLFLRKK